MQQLSRMLLLWSLGILWLCVGQGCTTNTAIAPALKSPTILIDSRFGSQSLNESVLVCTKLSEKDLARKDLKAWITENKDSVSQKKEAILVGPYRQYPDAWFYTQVINTDRLSHQLVVDEDNRIRCDGFEVFTVKDGVVKKWGSINRLTPFSGYPIPFLTFAIPFHIEPKDTLNLLIHTKRYYGKHEVNLGIWSYQTFLGEHIYHFLNKIFQIILFSICILMMFILGGIFRFKTMTYLAWYLISLLLIHLTSWGFTDALLTFKGIGLSANNASTFTVFLSAAFIHPFLMEWMKTVPKNEKVFKGISYFLIIINLFGSCCYLIPASVFPQIDAYFFLPQFMLISSLLTIIWLFYCSFLALIKSKIYYMLLGFSMAYLPYFLQQLNGILAKPSNILTQVHHPSFILAAIGLGTISIFLLRAQLVSRKKSEENLTQMQGMLEDIRKNEVETIGRNLHDQVGNTLASALGYLNMKQLQPETLKALIFNAINELRMISHNLVKDDRQLLSDKVSVLTERLNDFAATNFIFDDFSQQKMNTLPMLTQQNLYAVIQELLTNTLKHAQAQEAQVQFFETEGMVRVVVEDDGIGYNTQQVSSGIGLQNIRKRVALMKGQLTIDSTPQGTTTIVNIKL